MKTLFLLNILILSLLSQSLVSQQKSMLDPTETQYLIDIYTSLDGSNWDNNLFFEPKKWNELEVGKIYNSPNQLNYHGLGFTPNRDTTINDELIKIYKVKLIDFSKIINYKKIMNSTIPYVYFSDLNEILLTHLYYCDGLDNLNMPNVLSIKIFNSKIKGILKLSDMQKLIHLETDKSNIELDLNNINLPNCKNFILYDAGVKSAFSINNMENVENFIIDSKYYFNDGVDYYMGLCYLDGDVSELNKLTNAKTIKVYRAGLTGELSSLFNKDLEILELNGNKITGSLPTFTSDKIHTINLSNNSFEGEFTLPINNSTKFIDVSNNNLTGKIDFDIDFENLEVFKIDNNKFEGEIPKILSQNLLHIDLSKNNFNSFINDINVNQSTFINLSYNKIPISHLISRCDLFPNDRETFIQHHTEPYHILREFIFLYHEYHFNYIGTDVIYDNFPIAHIQYGENNISFDYNTNKLIVNDYDTLFTYQVALNSNLYNIDIDDKLKVTGNYRVKTKSKYCDIIRIDEIEITQLSVKNEDNFLVYKNGNILVIENNKNEYFTNIQVFDILGNILYQSDSFLENSKQIELQNTNQPLFVKIFINNNWIVKKLL